MSINLKIERKLDSQHVQVNLESDKIPTRYFKVPEAKADEFCSKYKKFHKEETVFSYIKVLVPTFVCCALGTTVTKNLGKIWSNLIGITAGAIGGAIAMPLNIKDIANRERHLLKEYGASEVHYLKKS